MTTTCELSAGVETKNPEMATTSKNSQWHQSFQAVMAEEWKYRFIYWFNAYPCLFMPAARLRYRHRTDFLVARDTDLVIEAFGRAGTTFATFAFLSAQTRPVKTAHHTHSAAQILVAAQRRIPTLVIVRKPEDSVLSHMARHNIRPQVAFIAWNRFHRRILACRDQLVVARFEQVLSNFGDVIGQINRKFDTDFAIWRHTRENEAAVFEQIKTRNRDLFGEAVTPARIRSLSIPTSSREALKGRLRAQLDSPQLTRLRHEAEGIYDEITE
jgi:hypothetical protein